MFSLVTAMLLLRGLTKEDFATWGLFLVVTYFLEMGRSGLLQNGLMTFVARYPDEEPAISTTALVLNLAYSALSIAAMCLGGHWLAQSLHLPQFVLLLPAYYASNIAMVFLYQSNFVQQAHAEFRGIFWGTFLHRGSLFGWVVWSKLAGHPLQLPDLGWVFFWGIFLGALASLFFSGKFFPRRLVWQNAWLARFWHYSKYVLGTNLSAMLYKNIDKLVLGQLAGPAAFAVYDAAGKVTQMVEAPSFSIASAVFPTGARMAQQDGPDALRRLYEQSVGAILAIVLPFLVLSVVFAKPLMLVFAGPAYDDAAGVLQVTAFFGLFMPFAVQFGTIMDASGHPDINFKYTFFTAVLNVLLTYALVGRFQLYGAACAVLMGYAISFVLMQRQLYQRFGIRWWRAFAFVPTAYRTVWTLAKNKLARKRVEA